ncbi:MAG: hypothetical protein HGA80_02875 [Candidatus Omnitrophica bacterium]|nr:hypothetical protein [Candidatus Omnitrophota bacterium]
MEFFRSLSRPRQILLALTALALLCGVALRIYNLRGSGFFFYDEGLYLNHNRAILEFIQSHSPMNREDSWRAFTYYAHLAMASGKSLWFFIVDSRFLWGALRDWEFGKVMASVFGLATLPLFFHFVRRFSGSISTALLAVGLLAILPGHVFYSRIGLQEAVSIFLVLAGFYLYLFPGRFGWRTLMAGLLFGAAFFANYRLCMMPILVFTAELWTGLVERRGIDWRRFAWFFVAFLACAVLIGNLFEGANTVMIFAWVFHQGDTARDVFAWVNLLSYPYYLFKMENWILTFFFFGNLYFVYKKQWSLLLPFVLVCAQMFIFSLTNEKGARYIAVMLPFYVLSAACFIRALYDVLSVRKRLVLVGVSGIMALLMLGQSVQLAQARSDYEKAEQYLEDKQPGVKFFAAQDPVMQIYVGLSGRVKPVPGNFEGLLKLYSEGYRYLVLGPQAYVDLGSGGRFLLPLKDYLSFIDSRADPVKVFPHMNYAMTERFVLEHSTNLIDSIRFLASPDIQKYSSVRIYDLSRVVPVMARIADGLHKKK